MIGFYVIMIAVLAMSGAVGYTIFTSVQTTNALSLAERNAARLEMTVSGLRQVIIADADGRLFVPMGAPSISGDPTSRTALPDWVSGEAITPWGADYAYCPYAPVAATGGAGATVYGGVDYAVTVTGAPFVYGAARDYVISGSRPANGLDAAGAPEVLAFLISPSNNATATPTCNSVYWDGRAWLTSGSVTGSVRALTLDGAADALSQAPRQLRRHVEQGATGSGLTAEDPAELAAVLQEWRYLRPHRMTIVLGDDGGPIVVAPASLDLGAGPGAPAPDAEAFGRHLVLEAAPSAAPVLNASSQGTLRFPSDLTLNGVDFGADLALSGMSGSRILIQDADLSSLETGGGDLTLKGGVTVVGSTAGVPPVRVTGGSLSIEGAVTINATTSEGAAIQQQGGRVHVDGSLTVTTGPSADTLFEADGYGEVSATASATLELDGATATEMDPYLSTAERTEPCGSGYACAATCPDQRVALSGTCSATTAGNVFLLGQTISGSTFTCSWGGVTGADPAPEPTASTATALCAPKR